MREPDSQDNDRSNFNCWTQFSLRSVLMLMLLFACYFAGWVSHRLYHNRNLDENIAAAISEVENKHAEVEVVDELGLTIVKAKSKEAVNAVISTIDQVKTAAQE